MYVVYIIAQTYLIFKKKCYRELEKYKKNREDVMSSLFRMFYK